MGLMDVLRGMHPRWCRAERCGGHTRTLYVRHVREGKAAGYGAVGTVCLRCHAVHLEETKLPPEPDYDRWRSW